MARPSPLVEHLLRRAGLGQSPAERDAFARLSYSQAVDALINFDLDNADVDRFMGQPGYLGFTATGVFSPNQIIDHARQRWLFRMVHTPAPLLERMALIWHHHFATAYTKIAGVYEGTIATRMLAAKPSEDPSAARGQIELFRQYALGSFRDLLVEVAKDPAMLVWLDGYLNTRARPQENFGRELMELFTFGVQNYVEADVLAAARVFTGWNLTTTGTRGTANFYYAFSYVGAQHDTNPKTFSFAIYPDGSKTIPGRNAASGMQDGLDLINALAIHPETAKRMARRLWTWFVSEVDDPDQSFVDQISKVYLDNDTKMRPVIRAVLMSPQFRDPKNFHKRYAWPAEFVVRSMKEIGVRGFSVDQARAAMINMGQVLLEPPDVNGWELGPGWFSTGGMLARMNFASTLATNQRNALRDATRAFRLWPETVVDFAVDCLSMQEPSPQMYSTLVDYVKAGGAWTGSEAQLTTKAGGLFHLLASSGAYQFI